MFKHLLVPTDGSSLSEAAAAKAVRFAKEIGADLVAMGSHGRTGIVSLILGSQTQRVLAHSRLPVIVYR